MTRKGTEDRTEPYARYTTKDFIEVFRHQQPYMADMMKELLQQNNIPCYIQEGAITGILKAAVFPAAYPGVEYVVLVPKKLEKKARAIIDKLPVDHELLNVKWRRDKAPGRQVKLFIFWLIVLGLGAIGIILATLHKVFIK
jgi:hypothetical protein